MTAIIRAQKILQTNHSTYTTNVSIARISLSFNQNIYSANECTDKKRREEKRMAERRMFAKSIVKSDAFADMPLSSQALYFHLGMEADDDGFVNNAKQIKRMIGASDDDLKILVTKRFIIPFESGVIVITHWHSQNQLRKDRYKPTRFIQEKELVFLNENKEYTLEEPANIMRLPDGKPPGNTSGNHLATQYSVVKDSIVKDSIGECKYQLGEEKLSEDEYNTLINKYEKNIVDEQINRILSHPYYNCLNVKNISQWCEEAKIRLKSVRKVRNSFNNFTQREHDDGYYESLEKVLLTTSVG